MTDLMGEENFGGDVCAVTGRQTAVMMPETGGQKTSSSSSCFLPPFAPYTHTRLPHTLLTGRQFGFGHLPSSSLLLPPHATPLSFHFHFPLHVFGTLFLPSTEQGRGTGTVSKFVLVPFIVVYFISVLLHPVICLPGLPLLISLFTHSPLVSLSWEQTGRNDRLFGFGTFGGGGWWAGGVVGGVD